MTKVIRILALATSLLLFVVHAHAQQLSGFVEHHKYFPVVLLYDGQVADVYAQPGDTVEKGTVLIEMDSTAQTAEVKVHKTNIQRLSIEYESSRAKFDRQAEMFDRGSLSLLAYENAENEIKVLQAQLTAARSQLQISENKLRMLKIVAPFDAVVLDHNVVPGMNIRADTQDPANPLMSLGSAQIFSAQFVVDHTTWQAIRTSGLPNQVNVDTVAYEVDQELSTLTYRYNPDHNSNTNTQFALNAVFHVSSSVVVPGLQATIDY